VRLRLLPLSLLSALAAFAFYAGAETATSDKLHKDMPVAPAEQAARHSAKSDCLQCHKPHALGYEHKDILCAACHIRDQGLRPAAEACVDCHEGKTTKLPVLSIFRGYHYRYEMRQPDEMLRPTCASCHKDRFNQPINPLVHPVRSAGSHIACLLCHDITKDKAKGESITGWDYSTKLCAQCHEDITRGFVLNKPHSLIKRNVRCRDCHKPHEGFNANLTWDNLALEGKNALLGYDPIASNELCLRCHSYLMLTTSASRFSYPDGLNLHAYHMDGEYASCVECHDPHLASSRGMLRDMTLEGDPFMHFALEDGGSCTVTCHGHEHHGAQYVPQS
jgi:hypothetical protein